MKSVAIKMLNNRLSEYVRLAAAGETILVTDRGLSRGAGHQSTDLIDTTVCSWLRSFEQLRVSASAHEVDRTAWSWPIIDLIDQEEVPTDMAFAVILPCPF